MQLTWRYRLSLLIVVSCSLVFLFYLRSQLNTHIDALLHNPLPSSDDSDILTHSDYPAVPPKIQLIAIWSPGDRPPTYLPNFFASVAANPTVDLLFIEYNRYNRSKEECTRPRAPGVPNVREVCLSEHQVWSLHVDFFCEWWRCDNHQRTRVVNTMVERAVSDRVSCNFMNKKILHLVICQVNSFYRPYRAAVFRRWIHPDTKLWVGL